MVSVIDVTMNKWLPHVHVEEHGEDGEGDTDPVARETHVQDTVSLIGGEGSPVARVRWFRCKGLLLLSKSWDVLVDLDLELRCDLVALDHLDNLLLLVVNMREPGSYLGQVLVYVVLHF